MIFHKNAQSFDFPSSVVIFTDPPYYDNIAYSELSDYFYILIKQSVKSIFP